MDLSPFIVFLEMTNSFSNDKQWQTMTKKFNNDKKCDKVVMEAKYGKSF